jgi:hypothetical protein
MASEAIRILERLKKEGLLSDEEYENIRRELEGILSKQPWDVGKMRGGTGGQPPLRAPWSNILMELIGNYVKDAVRKQECIRWIRIWVREE